MIFKQMTFQVQDTSSLCDNLDCIDKNRNNFQLAPNSSELANETRKEKSKSKNEASIA